MSEGAQKKSLIWILPAVVVVGLVLAILIPVSGAMETVTEAVARWFFAVFCTLYAIVQGRLYSKFRRRRSEGASAGVPVSAHGAFTAVWVVLAVLSIFYGIRGLGGRLEVAGWITIALVICMQMILLGRLDRRVRE
ncbi:MAG: hypothetical protein JSV86_20990 [Gemmatimonadota bacterium]|nr:MAG: hypothetical protein JSV86_20990 [Gemmatimonadota bacterium]